MDVTGGRYSFLKVAPTASQYLGRTIEFYYKDQKMTQIDTYASAGTNLTFNLSR